MTALVSRETSHSFTDYRLTSFLGHIVVHPLSVVCASLALPTAAFRIGADTGPRVFASHAPILHCANCRLHLIQFAPAFGARSFIRFAKLRSLRFNGSRILLYVERKIPQWIFIESSRPSDIYPDRIPGQLTPCTHTV